MSALPVHCWFLVCRRRRMNFTLHLQAEALQSPLALQVTQVLGSRSGSLLFLYCRFGTESILELRTSVTSMYFAFSCFLESRTSVTVTPQHVMLADQCRFAFKVRSILLSSLGCRLLPTRHPARGIFLSQSQVCHCKFGSYVTVSLSVTASLRLNASISKRHSQFFFPLFHMYD